MERKAFQRGFYALFDLGIKANTRCLDGGSLLTAAARHGNLKAVVLVLKPRGDIDSVTERGNSAFHPAASSGHTEVVMTLIRARADLNRHGDDRQRPVTMGASQGEEELSAPSASGREPLGPLGVRVRKYTLRTRPPPDQGDKKRRSKRGASRRRSKRGASTAASKQSLNPNRWCCDSFRSLSALDARYR